jgi:hypothetical protein
MAADGLLATAIQHEIDHLNGKLIIDFMSRLKRHDRAQVQEAGQDRGDGLGEMALAAHPSTGSGWS